MEDKLILLVEDNPHIMAINDAALHMRGYRTLQAETAHKCRELLCFHAVDLIVLDILLPDGDGVALCREIKQEYDVPILFLTAMGENEDIVKGLTAGGDDYLTKPYDLEVFMARVEARLRAAHPKERAVRLGPLQMNLLSGRAYIGETDLNLTQKEFAALLYLALLRRQGTVPPRSLAGELRDTEAALSHTSQLMGAVVKYAKTRPVFDGYKAARYSKKYLAQHEAELSDYRAAKAAMSELLDGAKLPKMDALKKRRRELSEKKKALYAEYRKAQADMREAVAVKGNIDFLRGYPDGREDKAQER